MDQILTTKIFKQNISRTFYDKIFIFDTGKLLKQMTIFLDRTKYKTKQKFSYDFDIWLNRLFTLTDVSSHQQLKAFARELHNAALLMHYKCVNLKLENRPTPFLWSRKKGFTKACSLWILSELILLPVHFRRNGKFSAQPSGERPII